MIVHLPPFLETAFEQTRDHAVALAALRRVGMLKPKIAVTATRGLRQWGPTLAGGYAASAERFPDRTGLVDDDGSMTFREIDERSNALANALAARGIGPRSAVAVLCRNSRWFVLSVTALNKLGANVLYMNTGFAGPQIAGVLEREGADLLVHDEEFTDAVAQHTGDVERIVADRPAAATGVTDLASLAADASTEPPRKPDHSGRMIILTSGTTGAPKGASRSNDSLAGLVPTAAVFERVPFRLGDVHVVPAPMFHSLGNAALLMAAQLSQTLVVTRRFDPETVMRLVSDHRARVLTAVPVMLQRMVELPAEVRSQFHTSSLEIVFASGSALPGSLALRWMDAYGDNLYNMYGSTEVAAATIATPDDLRAAPGTAGRPLLGVEVRLYDDDDEVVTEPDTDGRVFVGSGLRFDGYTGGETKPAIDGLLSSGDIGRWDDDGRLFVGGRDDDMIVSGGENLYPREVEDLLADLDGVQEAAVVGVEDEEYGARLVAFVVRSPHGSLDADAVKAHVKANLANYKVPRKVVFLDRLPRNATGKVLARELRERARDD